MSTTPSVGLCRVVQGFPYKLAFCFFTGGRYGKLYTTLHTLHWNPSYKENNKMKAADVISIPVARGVELWQEGGTLRYRAPVGAMTEQERATLRAHKSAILQSLASTTATTAGATVTANLATIEPAERECRSCTHFEPYPFEPSLGSCHALKRMQNAGSKPARFGCSHFEPKEGLS